MASEERKKEDLFIKEKRRATNFFVTSSDAVTGGVNKTTVSSSVFTEMSKSFSDGEHLVDDGIRELNGGVLYMLQEMQQDIDDVYNEVSASAFQASFFPFATIDSGSFGIISSSLVPDKDGVHHLGASGKEWQDLYIDGTANIDRLDVLAVGTDLIPVTPAGKGQGQNLGSAKARWSRIWLASHIDVSGSELVISSPSASVAGNDFNVIISGSVVAGDTNSGSIGTIDAPFKDLYVQSSSIYLADMSTHNFGSGNKTWKQMSRSEKLQRSTVFQKNDVDKLKRGESLNDSGIVSASGDLFVSGSTKLIGNTEIHGVTNIHGITDIRGGLKINQQSITDAEIRALRGLSTTDSLQDQLDSKQPTLTFGIGNTNVIKAGSGIADDDFLRINGTTLEGRSASELKGDLSLVKGDVGLGNVDNTSDASKPVSTATTTALSKKLNLTGGTMTGLIRPIVTAMKSAPNKGVIDARATNVFEFKVKQGATVATATPAFVGQELTIVNLGQGAITITHTGSKPQPGTFFIYGGKNLAIATGQVYKFVYTNVNQWFVIQ